MKDRKFRTDDQDNNFLGKVVFYYLPYWPLFALLIVMAVAGAWLYLRYTTPLYQSTARLMIKDENKGYENSKSIDELNTIATKKIIENEIEVIQSRTLLEQVVKNLHLYAPVLEDGKLRDASAYVTSPITVEAQHLTNIPSVKRVDFTYTDKTAQVSIGKVNYPINQWVATPYGSLRFMPNKVYRKSTDRDFYFALSSVKDAISDLQGRLDVKTTNKQTSILNLGLKDESPERGEAILNELLLAYNNAVVNDKNLLATNTLNFVETRLKNVEQDLAAIERRTQQYKARRGAIDIGEQGRLYLQNVSVNDQKLGDINMQLSVLNQVETYAKSKNAEAGIVPSTLGVADPVLSQLVSKLYTSELDYESAVKTTGEGNASMLGQAKQIQNMRSSILENINSQRQSLLASRSNLAATNGSYNAMLSSLPETQRELIDINREQSIKNGIYSFLLQKREETELSHASTVSDSRIVDAALSSAAPVTPKSKVAYLSALLAALFLGIGVVTARESLSRKIMFRHEIETLTTQPIIGEIVGENLKDPIVIGESNKTFIAEQFRRLRTTLRHIGVSTTNKRILVTSAISGEGKSFVATNLALSLALTGKRVVLIDCDLNNPSLNNKLKLHDEKGVTEYLQGKEDVIENIIRETDLNKNFFLISTGRLPRNPSELIMNGRMEEMLNQLDGMFDYIVIDTAPVSPVTDAYTLSPLCNATLFVIRHKYTPKVFVERIDEDNKINQLHNLAIVFNGIKSRGFGRKNYGYGYGYGYIFKDKNDRYQQISAES